MPKVKNRLQQGFFYYIYNRGAGGEPIFLQEKDRLRFLQALYLFNDKNCLKNILWRIERDEKRVDFQSIMKFCKEKGLERDPLVCVLAYCLAEKGFHLLLKEKQSDGISILMQKMGAYTRYFNNEHCRKGTIYEGRYKQHRILCEKELKYLLGYINISVPLQENGSSELSSYIADKEKDSLGDCFRWSSHQNYLGERKGLVVEKDIFEDVFFGSKEYRAFAEGFSVGSGAYTLGKDSFLDYNTR